MKTDIEILSSVITDYASDIVASFLGINLGIASKTLAKVGIQNMLKKKPYNFIIDFLTDEKGNIPDTNTFFDAFKEIVDEKPLIVGNIKFTSKDIEEIKTAFESKR